MNEIYLFETREQIPLDPTGGATQSMVVSSFPAGHEYKGTLNTLKQLVSDGISLTALEVGLALSQADLIAFAFWSGESQLEADARLLLRGDRSYEEIVLGGFWERAWLWISDFDFETSHPCPPGQRLTIAEIHTPHVQGCSGTFASSSSGSLNIAIEVLGLKYQRIKELTIESSYEIQANCAAITTGVQFEVHTYRHRFSGKTKAVVENLDIDGIIVGESLEQRSHQCRPSSDLRGKLEALSSACRGPSDLKPKYIPKKTDPGEDTSWGMKLEQGVVYAASLSLPLGLFSGPGVVLPDLPVFGINIESSVVNKLEMRWKLVSGHDYLFHRANRNDMRLFWNWA
jgi:hypothetical protein